jgi:hypothetical protein
MWMPKLAYPWQTALANECAGSLQQLGAVWLSYYAEAFKEKRKRGPNSDSASKNQLHSRAG